MKILQVFMLFLLVSSFCRINAQSEIKGKIIDSETEEALAYVNIGVIGKNIGTVSSIDGLFSLQIPPENNGDTLRISMVGYVDFESSVVDFRKKIAHNEQLELKKSNFILPEVKISDKKWKTRILGNKTTSKNMGAGFSSNELGNEVGIKIKIKKSPTYIEAFQASLMYNKYDSLKFRLNIYDLEDGMPHKRILYENIIIESQIKSGLLHVDLKGYNIVVHDDIFVSLEWIEDLGEGGLMFSASFFDNPIMARHTSQGDWEKINLISLGFNVKASY